MSESMSESIHKTPLTNLYVFRTLSDNHCFLLWRDGSKKAAVIDPAEEAPVLSALRRHGLELGLILNTHHHNDHVDGNLALQKHFNVPIFSSAYDSNRIPGEIAGEISRASRGLVDKERVELLGLEFTALAMPGHTLGQVAYYFENLRTSEGTHPGVFVGDTLFAMGCGRLFEGSAEQMWASLKRLMALPPTTRLYFGHEYTRLNEPFAKFIEPENLQIPERQHQAQTILVKGPDEIVPAPTLAQEMMVNPFLRIADAIAGTKIRRHLNLSADAQDSEVFRQLRLLRDNFKPAR